MDMEFLKGVIRRGLEDREKKRLQEFAAACLAVAETCRVGVARMNRSLRKLDAHIRQSREDRAKK